MMLSVRGLCVEFGGSPAPVTAVDGVSLSLSGGEALGLVGESGSGKTTLGLALTRLLPAPPATIRSGIVEFEGRDLLRVPLEELHRIRGGEIAYVFQEPSTSLNPVMTVGRQLIETLEWHTPVRGAAAARRAAELLGYVGIPSPDRRLSSYPHELSGGMKQRVMIAMAVACRPKLLVADEPTTALDVTLERQIILLLQQLQRDLGLGVLLISHNIHLVARLAQRMAVMWQGRIVEEGPTAEVLSRPRHEYTRRLLAAQPKIQAWSR